MRKIFPDGQFLTPALATVLFVAVCLAGVRYRRAWKTEAARWQLWLYGGIAAVGLLILGFVPLAVPA